MFGDFFIVKKDKNSIRDLYLKMKYLNILLDKYNNGNKLVKLSNRYRKLKIIDKMREEDKNVLNSVFNGYKVRKEIKEINNKNMICDVFKGYMVRKNIKKMKEKQDNINNIIEDNVISQINDNKMSVIELDNKINSEIIQLEMDEVYDNKLSDGISDIEDGLKNNLKGCELCCCGLGNILSVFWYKIKRYFSS